MSDAIPITAAQIGMVIALGKVFGISLSQTAAKSLLGLTLVQQAGRTVVANVLKAIPGVGTVVGGIIGATTAATLTEVLGWIIADDFYQLSNGEEPKDIIGAAGELKGVFDGLRVSK